MAAAAAIAGAAIVGGVAGSMQDKSESASTSRLNMIGETNLEGKGQRYAEDGADEIKRLMNNVYSEKSTQGLMEMDKQAQLDLAGFYKRLSEDGGLPNAAEIAAVGGFADQIYKPQEVAMKQSFEDQSNEYAKLQARMGRGATDPILQAKLRTGLMRQEAGLNAEKGAYTADMALKLPQAKLQYAVGGAQVMNNLAGQAFQNRAMLFDMGNSLLTQERNFRMGSADQVTQGMTASGGGFKGMLLGGLSGAATGAGMAGGMGGGMMPQVGGTEAAGVSGVGPVRSGTAYGQNVKLGQQYY